MKCQYEHIANGGDFWLKDKHWQALADAGWDVRWCREEASLRGALDADGRWLGALATGAVLRNSPRTLRGCAARWSKVTGMDPLEFETAIDPLPHRFILRNDDDTIVASGPEYTAGW